MRLYAFNARLVVALGATMRVTGPDGLAFTAHVEDNGETGRTDVSRLWIDGVLQNGSGAMSGGNIQLK
mgnify:CR=1 FL=1